jgi:hypothetical protein
MSKENKEFPRKQFLAKSVDVDSDERTLTAVITTGTVDRDTAKCYCPKARTLRTS